MKERNIVICIILSIVTCGLYSLYWFVKMTDEVNETTKEKGTSGIVALILTLVTCGLYGIYWAYKMGEKVNTIKRQPAGNNHILFIILMLFGLGIVNYCIIQDTLNKFVCTAAPQANEKPNTVGEFIEDVVEEAERAVEEVGEAIGIVEEKVDK